MSRLRERNRQRTEGMAGRQPAVAVSCDEMWIYRGVRRGEKREDCWIWTAVVREIDGSRWVDFEVGDHSEARRSCDYTKGCPRPVCTAATLTRCTWDGSHPTGTRWANGAP